MVGAMTRRQELVSLRHSGVAVMPSEHVIDFAVRDANNERIGDVDDLIVDVDTNRVRYLVAGQGGVMGFGRTHHLIPVDIIHDVVGGSSHPTVYLNVDGALVSEAPRGDDLQESHLSMVCRHFGCEPYWSEGYVARDWTAAP